MITLTADSSGVSMALQWAAAMRGQLPYAMSNALNQAAYQISQDLRNQTPAFFDRPNPYTKAGFFYTQSTKANLKALVTAGNTQNPNDRRRRYLATQIGGGARGSTGLELKTASFAPALSGYKLVPTKAAKRDGYGNVASSVWKKLNAGNTQWFGGVPKGGARPLGVYVREGNKLKALMIAKSVVNYQARFPMEKIADQTLRRNWPTYLTTSLTKALATAR